MSEPIHSVTENDLKITYARGSGKGGQKRNKTETKVRIQHPESGAVGVSDDTRSQHLNKKAAFLRMIETPEFKNWHKMEIARVMGQEKAVQDIVDSYMKRKNDFIIEVKEDGKWARI